MHLRCSGLFLGVLLISQQAMAEPIKWESLGRRDDYAASWASNIHVWGNGRVGTELRFTLDRAARAPNDRLFDNRHVVVDIDCARKQHVVLEVSYYMDNTKVYAEKVGGDFKPNSGPYVDKVAAKLCPSAS